MSADASALIDVLGHMFSCYFAFKGATTAFRLIFRLVSGE